MRRLLLAAAATFACVATAHATTWSFDYVGATSDAPFSLPSIAGHFTADDLNADGVIGRDEVQALDFFNYQVAPSVDMQMPGQPPGTATSALTSFTFDVNTQALSFTGYAGSWGDSYEKTDTELRYATGIGLFTFNLADAALHIQLDGTSVSQGEGSPSPVPEPSTWVMLGVGLAAIALRRRVKPQAAR